MRVCKKVLARYMINAEIYSFDQISAQNTLKININSATAAATHHT
jgi:hypothetical protein